MSTIALDKERRLIFGPRAQYRIGSLARPFDLTDIGKPRRGFAALCAWVWACLDGGDIADPEDVAAFLDTPEKHKAALDALVAALSEANPTAQKKST